MLALLVLFAAGLSGYCNASVLAWPAAALSLASISWAEHYLLAPKGVELGLDDVIGDTLLRSSANALIAAGACYWSGVLMRSFTRQLDGYLWYATAPAFHFNETSTVQLLQRARLGITVHAESRGLLIREPHNVVSFQSGESP